MFRVRIMKKDLPEQVIECATKQEAERVAYDYRSAFPSEVKANRLLVIIEEY